LSRCGERVWVGGLLGHKLCWSRLKFIWSASSSVLLVGFCFQRLLLLSVHPATCSKWRGQQFDQCDQLEEERGRTPNLSEPEIRMEVRDGEPRALPNHRDIKILVHINPKSAGGRTRPVASLIAPVLPLNWLRVSSCEDNSVLLIHCISAGEPNNLPALFTCHLFQERVHEWAFGLLQTQGDLFSRETLLQCVGPLRDGFRGVLQSGTFPLGRGAIIQTKGVPLARPIDAD
jgi:hypothetical protein